MLMCRRLAYSKQVHGILSQFYSQQANVCQPIQKPVQEISIPVPWGHIAGKWWGRTDVQPLLGLHGWEDNSGTFDALVPHLDVESFLAIDFVGHGMSSHLQVGRFYNYMDFIILVRMLHQWYKWEKFSVLGHSLGSSVGFMYAGFYPDAIDRFISIECARSLITGDKTHELEKTKLTIDRSLAVDSKLGKEAPAYEYDQLLGLLYEAVKDSMSLEACKLLLRRGCNKVVKDGKEWYHFSRDPRLRTQWLGRLPEEVYNETAARIKCKVLSIRGLQGSLFGGDEERVYLQTLNILKNSASYFEYHEVEGKWWGATDVKPILCVHGWQDNAGTWDTLAPLLPPDISLLAIDLPGHGLSSHYHPGQPYYQTDYVVLVRRIVNHFHWDKVCLMGHSLGSILCFTYAATFPGEVTNYIGIDALEPWVLSAKTLVAERGQIIDKIIESVSLDVKNNPTYTLEEVISVYEKATNNSLSRDSCEVLVKRGMVKHENGRYSFSRDLRLKYSFAPGWPHENTLSFAAKIDCNVLNIKADPGLKYNDEKNHLEVVDVLKKNAKYFEYHVVEGTHHVHLNNPERVAPIITKFLQKCKVCNSS